MHQCAFAFMSDYSILMTALIPHGELQVQMIASLDHAIWFHAPLNMNDWTLLVVTSPRAGSGRAFVKGELFSTGGTHLATLVQEGVARAAHL